MSEPCVTLHMVSSLDGFIAKKDGDVSWMRSTDHYETGHVLTEEEITNYLASIDCYVMGSNTYEHALELGWVYGEKPVFVLTSRKLSKERETVTFYQGDLKALLNDHLTPHLQNIWLVGGSQVAKAFLQQDLVDEIILSIMPIVLGDGILFFDFVEREKRLHLKDVKAYQDGMVELHYEILR